MKNKFRILLVVMIISMIPVTSACDMEVVPGVGESIPNFETDGSTTNELVTEEVTEEAPVEASTIDTTPAEEKEPIINPEAVNSIKNAFSAGKSFLKKAFAKTESTDETTAE